jgi:SAM-dependent methyltransferase
VAIKKLKFKLMFFYRRKKMNRFLSLGILPNDTILDIGIANVEYSPFDNFLEKYYAFPGQITALSIDKADLFRNKYPQVNVIEYSGGTFPFRDNEFNIAHCNAVIEHVGGIGKQIQFVKEIYRVSIKSFLTTPSRWFPIEIHTHLPLLHFLPKNIFDWVLHKIGKQWASGEYMHLLSKKQLKNILRAADISNFCIETIRFFGFPNQYIVIIGK